VPGAEVVQADGYLKQVTDRAHALALSKADPWRFLRSLAEKPKRTEVQSVICAKSKFDSAEAAAKWCREHDFKGSVEGVDETEESYRFRQFDPGACQEDSHRTIELTEGVKAVICKKQEGMCRTSTPDLWGFMRSFMR
jgi:hypothetical protein